MIIGFHISWTTYGHWFPNDPRGSWSDEVWQPRLAAMRDLDDGRKVTRPRDVPKSELKRFMHVAGGNLKWDVVVLTEAERAAVAGAFTEVVSATDLAVYACAILADHVHILIERHADSYERVINRLKGRSSQRVRESRGLAVAEDRRSRVPIWSQGYWSRYIDNLDQMECAINYVKQNPVKAGLGVQEWQFVQEYR